MRKIKFRAWDTEKGAWIEYNGTTFTSAEISEGPVMLSLDGHLRVLGSHHGPLQEDVNDPEKITGCFGGPSHSEYESIHPCDTNPTYKRQYILMQFTGLKDKNGKEIYEGDIVARLETDWPSKSSEDTRGLDEYLRSISKVCSVEFNERDASFACKYKDGYRYGGDAIYTMFTGSHGRIEIIGNIYENPELIKVAA